MAPEQGFKEKYMTAFRRNIFTATLYSSKQAEE